MKSYKLANMLFHMALGRQCYGKCNIDTCSMSCYKMENIIATVIKVHKYIVINEH